jgi:tubulin polyglutamylase TTLL5
MIHRNFKSNPRIIRQRMVHIVIFISMIFVLYSLGFLAHDPLLKRIPNRQNLGPHVRNHYQVGNTRGRLLDHRTKRPFLSSQRQRCQSAGLVSSRTLSGSSSSLSNNKSKQVIQDSERGLTSEELRVLRDTKDEFTRRGHFVRIFPAPNSRERYGWVHRQNSFKCESCLV